ncbi:MAG: ABC transporter ATP-binding protein [Oscillospiraceae bacterium]|nr:ABC transporter ATP-binding protein [Oscillospiraceae bacterium]
MDILSLQDVCFSYNEKRTILNNVNLSIEEGEVFCIVGPNGCGKSTLIDCILGINKIDSGKILLAGKDTCKMKPNEFAKYAAYVPQAHAQTFSYTVMQIVLMGRTFTQNIFSPGTKEDKEIALNAIETVGLRGYEERDYSTLSGGELQLVLIARAIAQKSKLLIMDEPTAHLDFKNEIRCMELICQLVKENNLSVVMATHFLNQAYFLENAGIKTSVGLLNDGCFEITGEPSNVLIPENLSKTFNIVAEVAADASGERKYILPLRNI